MERNNSRICHDLSCDTLSSLKAPRTEEEQGTRGYRHIARRIVEQKTTGDGEGRFSYLFGWSCADGGIKGSAWLVRLAGGQARASKKCIHETQRRSYCVCSACLCVRVRASHSHRRQGSSCNEALFAALQVRSPKEDLPSIGTLSTQPLATSSSHGQPQNMIGQPQTLPEAVPIIREQGSNQFW